MYTLRIMFNEKVKTIHDLILWQYARLVTESAGYRREHVAVVKEHFQKFKQDEEFWLKTIREYIFNIKMSLQCSFCAKNKNMSMAYLLPLELGGIDVDMNLTMMCGNCKEEKGERGLYEWFGLNETDNIPRKVEGKYLKLLYDLHMGKETLHLSDFQEYCPKCHLGEECGEERKKSLYCLEGILANS